MQSLATYTSCYHSVCFKPMSANVTVGAQNNFTLRSISGTYYNCTRNMEPLYCQLLRSPHYTNPKTNAKPSTFLAARQSLTRTDETDPQPVIVTIRDSGDYMRVLLFSYYTTIIGCWAHLTPKP